MVKPRYGICMMTRNTKFTLKGAHMAHKQFGEPLFNVVVSGQVVAMVWSCNARQARLELTHMLRTCHNL